MSRMMGFIHDELARDGHEIEYVGSDDVRARVPERMIRFASPDAFVDAVERLRASPELRFASGRERAQRRARTVRLEGGGRPYPFRLRTIVSVGFENLLR